MKNWYKSRMIWFAILTGIAGVIMALATEFPEVGWLITAGSVVNFILRCLTTGPVK